MKRLTTENLKPTEVHTNIDIVIESSGLEGVIDSWKKYSTNPTSHPPKKECGKLFEEKSIELALKVYDIMIYAGGNFKPKKYPIIKIPL